MKTISFFLLLFTNLFYQQKQADLLIKFDKPVDKGKLLVYIYNSADGFPQEKIKIFRKEIFICKQTKHITINNLAFGSYAIIVVHDKNNNEKLDRNWVGFPAEPYALSGNPKFHFGPPRYEEVKFDFNKYKKTLYLKF